MPSNRWREARQAYVDAFPFYRQPTIRGVVSEDAQKWLDEARLYADRAVARLVREDYQRRTVRRRDERIDTMTSKYARRHYEDVAEIMRVHTPHPSDPLSADGRHARLIVEFADLFERDNPRFSRDRFLTACVPTTRG